MEDIAGWVAPAATMIAAMMTAANFGTRFTGWGFVVFTVGSIGWCLVAFATDQQNLLWTNAVLTLVNLIGVWRWLGRQARFEDATDADRDTTDAAVFKMTDMQGVPVTARGGATVGHVVDAISDCRTGAIRHFVIRTGGVAGVGETLRSLDFDAVKRVGDPLKTDLDADAIRGLPVVQDGP